MLAGLREPKTLSPMWTAETSFIPAGSSAEFKQRLADLSDALVDLQKSFPDARISVDRFDYNHRVK